MKIHIRKPQRRILIRNIELESNCRTAPRIEVKYISEQIRIGNPVFHPCFLIVLGRRRTGNNRKTCLWCNASGCNWQRFDVCCIVLYFFVKKYLVFPYRTLSTCAFCQRDGLALGIRKFSWFQPFRFRFSMNEFREIVSHMFLTCGAVRTSVSWI